MSTKITMKQRFRGPHLTLSFNVVSKNAGGQAACTENINVNGLAVVFFLFNHVMDETWKLESTMKFKNGGNETFAFIDLTCDGLEKRSVCHDDWFETKMRRKTCDYNIPISSGYYIISTSIDINISAHEFKATCLPANKLYDDGVLTDFRLQATDGVVAMHKAILAMHSDVFMTMLSGKWKETEEGHVTIDGVSTRTLEHLKQYLYLGTLPDDGLESLLLVASRYMMDNLKTDCIMKLLKTVTPENLDGLIEFACANNVPDLVRAILFNTPDTIVHGLYKLGLKGEVSNLDDGKEV